MCIAIPLGNKTTTNESELWRNIRNSPLYLLGIGFVIQSFIGIIFFLGIKTGFINSSSLQIPTDIIALYAVLFASGSFLFFSLSMHYCPKVMHTGNIEYLYYGGLFYLSNYNMVIFYLASVFSYPLLIISTIFQLLLMLYAFKPIWHAHQWANKRYQNFSRMINTLFVLLFSAQLMVFWLLLNAGSNQ